MAVSRYNAFRNLLRSSQIHTLSSHSLTNPVENDSRIIYRSLSSYSRKSSDDLPWTSAHRIMPSKTDKELSSLLHVRLMATQTKAPPTAKMGAVQFTMTSPGIVMDPWAPREKVPFWTRWFTKTGWKGTKEEILTEVRNAYAIAKLRKTGYSRNMFYNEAALLYKEINSLLANGDKGSLRKKVTERMYSALKNEIKQRELKWNNVYWELIEPIVKIRTLRARLISVDKNSTDKVFIQLTLEFLSKQKFEAYDSNGKAVAGDKEKEVLVRDVWVFEKSLFHKGSFWRLCGRIKLDLSPA